MKIIRIKVQNINSLRGVNELNFEESPLKDAGLFAIMGPTGSGKSTLLDAVCLALFNRIPRIAGGISKTNVESNGSIVTHHCKEASAEIEYSCSSGVFISRWSIRMTKNGTWADYNMELENRSEQRLEALKKTEVPGRNEALIGLNYDQFVKSMLLAQGEFSKFLKSGVKERVELLEKITNGEIYRNLGKKAYERFKVYEDEQKTLQKRIDEEEGKMISAADFKILENQLQEKDAELIALQAQLEKQAALLRQFESNEQLEKELSEIEKRKLQCSKNLDAFKSEFELKMRKQEELLHLEDALDLYSRSKQNKERGLQEVSKLRQKRQEQSNLKTKFYNEINTFLKVASPIAETDVPAELQALQNKYNQLFEDIKDLRAKAHERQNFMRLGYQKYIDIDFLANPQNTQKIEAKIHLLEQTVSNLESILDQQEKLNPQTAIVEWNRISSDVEKLQQVERDHSSRQSELNKVQRELEQFTNQATATSKLVEEKKNERLIKEKDLKLNQVLLQNAQLKASLEEHRKLLKDGEPCPLCGALHHPFANEKEQPSQLSGTITLIKDLEEQLKILNDELVDLGEKFNLFQSGINTSNALLKKIGEEQLQLQVRMNELIKLVPESYRNFNVSFFNSRIQQITNYEKSFHDLKELKNLKELWSEFITQVDEGLAMRVQLNELFTGDGFSKKWTELNTGWQLVQSTLNSLDSDLVHANSTFIKQEQDLAKIEHDLMEELQPLGYGAVSEALANFLSRQEYQLLNNKKNTFLTELAQEQKMFDAKSLEVEKAKALVLGEDRLKTSEFVKQGSNKKQTLQIEKDNLLVNIDREKQFRKNLDDFKQLLQVSKDAGKNWQLMNKLIGDATGSKFSSYAQKLTLKQLTIAANQRLEQLDKRYHLVASDTQNQELQVIDRDMGNSLRTVNTLSGGETFLMSLALALGLSDLASHKVQLGSLFIDEGFGTLDPEVLEKTITMLEKLQMQDNKTIGIISHVEALKERIRVKVNVVKNGQGYSEVRV